MPDTSEARELVTNVIMRAARRSTLPFQQPVTGRHPGTAFWFNDLIDARRGKEKVQRYLLTAAALTHIETAEFHLRDGLADPGLSAERLVMQPATGNRLVAYRRALRPGPDPVLADQMRLRFGFGSPSALKRNAARASRLHDSSGRATENCGRE